MKIIIAILFALCILSCNNSNDRPAKTDSAISKTNGGDTLHNISADTASDIYCYITGIEKIRDSMVLKVDYVDFFHGPNVLEEAKKRHRADTAFDRNGKIKDIFVPNDYFIVNDDKSLRSLYLPPASPITMDSEIAGNKSKDINTYAYFSKHYENSLFLLKVKDNSVQSVKEVFLP